MRHLNLRLQALENDWKFKERNNLKSSRILHSRLRRSTNLHEHSRQQPGPRQASQVETACAPQHTGNIYILKYIPKIYARGYRHRVPSPDQQPHRNPAQPLPTCSAFLPIPSQPPGQASSSIPAPWKSICKPALWFLSVTADTVLKCNERFPCTFVNHNSEFDSPSFIESSLKSIWIMLKKLFAYSIVTCVLVHMSLHLIIHIINTLFVFSNLWKLF